MKTLSKSPLFVIYAIAIPLAAVWIALFGFRLCGDTYSYIEAWDTLCGGRLDGLRTPLYPLLLGLPQLLFGRCEFEEAFTTYVGGVPRMNMINLAPGAGEWVMYSVVCLQYVVFLISIAYFYKICRRMLRSPKASVVLTCIYAFSILLPAVNNMIQTEGLAVSLFVIFVYALTRVWDSGGSWRTVAAASLLLLLLLSLRPSFLYLLPVCGVFCLALLLRRSRRGMAVRALVALALLGGVVCAYCRQIQKQYGVFSPSTVTTLNNSVRALSAGILVPDELPEGEMRNFLENVGGDLGFFTNETGAVNAYPVAQILIEKFGAKAVDDATRSAFLRHPAETVASLLSSVGVCNEYALLLIPHEVPGHLLVFHLFVILGLQLRLHLYLLVAMVAFVGWRLWRRRRIDPLWALLMLIYAANYLTAVLGAYMDFSRLLITEFPLFLLFIAAPLLFILKNPLNLREKNEGQSALIRSKGEKINLHQTQSHEIKNIVCGESAEVCGSLREAQTPGGKNKFCEFCEFCARQSLAVKIIAVLAVLLLVAVGPIIDDDTKSYFDAWQSLCAGHLDLWRTPIYPAFAGLCQWLAGACSFVPTWQTTLADGSTYLYYGGVASGKAALWLMACLQYLVFLLSLPFLRKVVLRLTHRATYANVVVAVYACVLIFSGINNILLTEGLALSMTVFLAYSLQRVCCAPHSVRHALLAGLWVLLLVFLRPVCLFLLPVGLVVGVWVAWRRTGRRAGIVFGAAVVVVAALMTGYCAQFARQYGIFSPSAVGVINRYAMARTEIDILPTRVDGVWKQQKTLTRLQQSPDPLRRSVARFVEDGKRAIVPEARTLIQNFGAPAVRQFTDSLFAAKRLRALTNTYYRVSAASSYELIYTCPKMPGNTLSAQLQVALGVQGRLTLYILLAYLLLAAWQILNNPRNLREEKTPGVKNKFREFCEFCARSSYQGALLLMIAGCWCVVVLGACDGYGRLMLTNFPLLLILAADLIATLRDRVTKEKPRKK